MANQPQQKYTRACQICESIDYWLKDKDATKDAFTRLKIKAMMPKLSKFRKYSKFVREVDSEHPNIWKRDISKVKRIVLHYTYSTPLPAGRSEVDGVFKQHTGKVFQGKHYKGVQYNFLIDTDGTINYTRDIRISAGANSNSAESIAICYQGGRSPGRDSYTHIENGNKYNRAVGVDTRTPEQKDAILNLTQVLMAIFPNIKEIVGHRDTNGYEDYKASEASHKIMEKNKYTQCPGFWVKKDPIYSQINKGEYRL